VRGLTKRALGDRRSPRTRVMAAGCNPVPFAGANRGPPTPVPFPEPFAHEGRAAGVLRCGFVWCWLDSL